MNSKTFLIFGLILLLYVIIDRVRHLPNVFKMYSKSEIKQSKLRYRELFVDYLRKFNKSYETDEFYKRLRYFKAKLIKIRKLNHGSSHVTYGLTKFSDWSRQEFSQMLSPQLGGCLPLHEDCERPLAPGYGRTWTQAANRTPRFADRGNVPAKWDWRKQLAVGKILDQKRCPVCWAFSIIGVMESMAFIQGDEFTRLSIQNLIDCSYNQIVEKTGCRTGRPMIDVFEFLCHSERRHHRTVATEADYPLTFADQKCQEIDGKRSLKSYYYSCDMYLNEDRLVEALTRGPVTAVVDAYLLENYVEGVIQENCNAVLDSLNHAVQIVGYDKTASPPYYIVRNSWGDDWGEKGYVRLAIGGNQCGIAYTVGQLEVY